MPQMYIETCNGVPVAYRYCEYWTELLCEGGYPTEEEAMEAWRRENDDNDVVQVGKCDGCAHSHRKRPQKCSCCRRNPDMKDCYEEG